MCKLRQSVKRKIQGRIVKLDSCIAETIVLLNKAGVETRACCCGHGRYPPSIIIKDGTSYCRDLYSDQTFSVNEKNFYVTDKLGFYHLIGTEDAS